MISEQSGSLDWYISKLLFFCLFSGLESISESFVPLHLANDAPLHAAPPAVVPDDEVHSSRSSFSIPLPPLAILRLQQYCLVQWQPAFHSRPRGLARVRRPASNANISPSRVSCATTVQVQCQQEKLCGLKMQRCLRPKYFCQVGESL